MFIACYEAAVRGVSFYPGPDFDMVRSDLRAFLGVLTGPEGRIAEPWCVNNVALLASPAVLRPFRLDFEVPRDDRTGHRRPCGADAELAPVGPGFRERGDAAQTLAAGQPLEQPRLAVASAGRHADEVSPDELLALHPDFPRKSLRSRVVFEERLDSVAIFVR